MVRPTVSVCPCVSRVSRVACVSRLPPVSFLTGTRITGTLGCRGRAATLAPCVCNSNPISTTVSVYSRGAASPRRLPPSFCRQTACV